MAKAALKIFCVVSLLGCALAFNLCENKEDGERVPYSLDCTKFFVCEGFDVAYIKTCPSGLHFNQNVGECDLKKYAGCEQSNIWAAADTCDTSSCCACCDCSGCSSCENDLTNCQGQPDNSVQQYPNDCSKYIVCHNECATVRDCPTGQLWNPNTRSCDIACNVDCPGSGYPCNTCSNNLTICEGKPENSLQQYPGDCSKYVTCNNGCATIYCCESGQLWNSNTQTCDKACNVDCPGSGYPCNNCSNNMTICEGKPDNSLQQYPGDCSKYVTCNNGCATVTSCASGQLWNPNTQICDKACNVDCPGSGFPCNNCSNNLTICEGKPDNSLQQYPGDCSKYVTCNNGCATVNSCASGQLWNPNTQTCDKACNVDCPGSGYPCSNCSNNMTICEGKPDNSLQQYPGDCSKYVTCNNGCATVNSCASGQLWNPNTQACDKACNVDCPGSGFPCNNCSNNLTICEGKPDNSLQQYPGDCSKYVTCNNGCATVNSCASGQLWNPNTHTCDKACNVDCPGSGYPCNNCSNNLTICEGKPDNSLQQYPGDCSKYVTCNNGCATVNSCASGQLWNPNTQACDKACNVDCPGSGYPCSNCSNNMTICEGKPDNSLQQYPGDCSKYVTCNNGCATVNSCASGQLWNPNTQTCDKACNVDCPGSGYPCNNCSNNLTICEGKPDNTLQQYPGDCSKYVTCNNGCATVNSCASGQLWNPNTQTCDKACNVDCPGSGYPCNTCTNNSTVCQNKPNGSYQEYPGDCTQYIVCENNCAIYKSCPKNELWDPETNSCEDACSVNCSNNPYPCSNEDCPFCEGKPPGSIQPHPDSCQVYIICNANCDIFECPNGELFNPNTQRCEIACNVDCPGSGYPCSRPPTGPSGESCDSPGKCRDQPDGTLFKDDNSNGYIVCQCECEIARPCPPSLEFNEALQTCDWPVVP